MALALAFCGLKLALLAIYAWNSQFVMDEFTVASSTRYIRSGFYDGFDPVKTVLHVYFYDLGRWLTDTAVGWMRIARLQGLALALAMTALTYGIARNLWRDRRDALSAVVVLLAFTTFLERSFRIRSEPLAVSLPLLALWLATGHWRDSRWARFVAGIAVGGAFLTTQKAAYYALAFGLAYLIAGMAGDGGAVHRLRRAVADAGMFSAGWASSLLVYSLAFGGTEFWRVLHMVFTSPLDAVFHGDDVYTEFASFVLQTLAHNLLAYGLGACGLLIALGRWRQLKPQQLLAAVITLVITVAVFTNSQPWPYVFVMAIPFLALWSPLPIHWVAPPRRTAVLLTLLAILSASFVRNLLYLQRDNVDQRLLMNRAEQLLGPDETYSDGVGMIPSRPWAGELWNWDAMALARIRGNLADGDPALLVSILEDQPKLWIYNYRSAALGPVLEPLLNGSTVRVDPNILLSGTELRPGDAVVFRNRWAGTYRLYGRDGRPLRHPYRVGSREVQNEIQLAVGIHRVDLAPGAKRVFLLPAGLTLPGPIPTVEPPRSLFAGVYE